MQKKFKLYFILGILALIPVIYSSLFLGSMMDPYGKVNHLPVAIVNKNPNTVYDNLLKANLFNYRIENLDTANQDLKDGKVYSIIYFEDDFQENLNRFVVKQKSPTIQLITSEGLSYSTTKILSNVMNQFVNEANDQISSQIITQMGHNNIPSSISSVITLDLKDVHPVKNNGEAMAPYILSLTLFVGGIFVNQFIIRIFANKGDSFFTYWKKQFLIPLIIAVCQVFLLLLINYLFIHIKIDQVLLFIPFLLLVAATFSSIIVAFNKLIPGIGSLIVLLLTMLQTSSSGGAYTIDLSGSFFQKIHLFLPMTYSINGMKKLMSLNNTHVLQETVILFLFFLVGQIILIAAYKRHEEKNVNHD